MIISFYLNFYLSSYKIILIASISILKRELKKVQGKCIPYRNLKIFALKLIFWIYFSINFLKHPHKQIRKNESWRIMLWSLHWISQQYKQDWEARQITASFNLPQLHIVSILKDLLIVNAEKEMEDRKSETVHPLVHSSNVYNSQCCARIVPSWRQE